MPAAGRPGLAGTPAACLPPHPIHRPCVVQLYGTAMLVVRPLASPDLYYGRCRSSRPPSAAGAGRQGGGRRRGTGRM